MPDWAIALAYAAGGMFWWWVFDRFDEWKARRLEERESAMRDVTPRD